VPRTPATRHGATVTEPARARGLKTPEGSLLGGSVTPAAPRQSVARRATVVETKGYYRLFPPMVRGAQAEEYSRFSRPKEPEV